MNILIAIHHFPPKFTGGAEWCAYNTAKLLISRGHTVRVVCVESISTDPDNNIDFQDDIYHDIPVRRLYFNLNSSPDPFKWKYFNPWIADQISQLIQEEQPDLFHLFSGYLMTTSALHAAINANVANILTVTDFWFYCPLINLIRTNGEICQGRFLPLHVKAMGCAQCIGEERRRLRIPGKVIPKIMQIYWKSQKKQIKRMEDRISFLQATLKKVDTIISPSNFLRNYFIKGGIDEDCILFSRQGIDQTGFKPARSSDGLQPLRVGYIGQIAPHKGIHILLEALNQLQLADLNVNIFGNLQSFPQYSAKIQEDSKLDQRVHIMGPYNRADINQVFNNLDVLVMPSLCYENSPNVILEAFAFKLPVIASNLGGMAELVQDHENGFLFEVGNAADLADKINQLLVDPSILQRMAAKIPPVKTVEEEIDELEAVYQMTLDRTATNISG